MRKDANTGVIRWDCKLVIQPTWTDQNGKVRKSDATGRPMRYMPILPDQIPVDIPDWRIVGWMRQAAIQLGQEIRYLDIFDRMSEDVQYSTLSIRMQRWLGPSGALPLTATTNLGWLSKASIDSVIHLSYIQARVNTWWSVEYNEYMDTYFVGQPGEPRSYDEQVAVGRTRPWYIIEDHRQCEVSECVDFDADAILFLQIKAEEGGFAVEDLLSWLSKASTDHETRDFRADIRLEFERWRKGCPDSLSVEFLREGLSKVSSEAEIQAIKAADYSFSMALSQAELDLVTQKVERRRADTAIRNDAKKREIQRNIRKSKKAKVGEDAGDADKLVADSNQAPDLD